MDTNIYHSLFAAKLFMKALACQFLMKQDPDVTEEEYEEEFEEDYEDEDFREQIMENIAEQQDDNGDAVTPRQFNSFVRHEHQQQVNRAELPETATVLTNERGETVYLIGTAHFSKESCRDVQKVISMVQPDAVMVELCTARSSILTLDERYLEAIKETSWVERMRRCIKEKGVMSGMLVYLLQESSNNITSQIGMAPGEEMRTAYHEAAKVMGCSLYMGDRRVDITLKRMLGKLSFKDKVLLGLRMYKDVFTAISAEEIEEMKKKDIFEKLYEEIAEHFPHLSKVLIEERDVYLTASLKQALANPVLMPGGFARSPVIVAVVGIGHTPGMSKYFHTDMDAKKVLADLNTLPPEPASTGVLGYAMKGTLITITCYSIFRVLSWTSIFDNYPSINWI